MPSLGKWISSHASLPLPECQLWSSEVSQECGWDGLFWEGRAATRVLCLCPSSPLSLQPALPSLRFTQGSPVPVNPDQNSCPACCLFPYCPQPELKYQYHQAVVATALVVPCPSPSPRVWCEHSAVNTPWKPLWLLHLSFQLDSCSGVMVGN